MAHKGSPHPRRKSPRRSRSLRKSARKSRSPRKSSRRSRSSRKSRRSSRKSARKSRSPRKSMTAYCVGCRKPHAMGKTKMRTSRNNRKMLVGKCSRSGVKMCRFV